MSANPASSQVRHSTAGAARVPNAPPAARSVPTYTFVSSEVDDELKLHLNDIPRQKETLDVEGLKPSLLSRLLEIVAPINKG
jgi:hypothetical protein